MLYELQWPCQTDVLVTSIDVSTYSIAPSIRCTVGLCTDHPNSPECRALSLFSSFLNHAPASLHRYTTQATYDRPRVASASDHEPTILILKPATRAVSPVSASAPPPSRARTTANGGYRA